jgi:ubiquinone/menaquinone biosynthesis C-methylase UbiE
VPHCHYSSSHSFRPPRSNRAAPTASHRATNGRKSQRFSPRSAPAPGKRIADVAAGKGYLTKPLATAVGKAGRVYAVEIGTEELAALRTLSQQEGFTNIEVIAASESDPHLPANLDGVVILNSYHELSDYKSTLAGIKRALRAGGLLVLVDNNPTRPGWFTERNDQRVTTHSARSTSTPSCARRVSRS